MSHHPDLFAVVSIYTDSRTEPVRHRCDSWQEADRVISTMKQIPEVIRLENSWYRRDNGDHEKSEHLHRDQTRAWRSVGEAVQS